MKVHVAVVQVALAVCGTHTYDIRHVHVHKRMFSQLCYHFHVTTSCAVMNSCCTELSTIIDDTTRLVVHAIFSVHNVNDE